MASRNFTHLSRHYAHGRINYSTGAFKAVLVASIPSEANLDAWEYLDDVTIEIAAGGGYSLGGFDVTMIVAALDAANDLQAIALSAASPTYETATISAVGCIVYQDTGDGATSPLICFVDYDGTITSTAGNFTGTFDDPVTIAANPA
ncbi:hypothetical protein [Kineobactrum salinum]|uniref:Uncharacterized protein n=1 Tax=Kineobactrum salinum TaxID=2708301 RepID=A0A6C0U988_9GAMM|nr:hypothetical protein [Kineobactrum salinum]QIB67185.1 hypothetical protein G3T16_19015 [Kineobactrum salinum]